MRQLICACCCLSILILSTSCSGGTARSKRQASGSMAAMTADQLADQERRLLEEQRRAGKSEIRGLTIGQVEDMPPLPPLPRFINMKTAPEQLALQAKLTAESEDLWLLPPTVSVEDRIRFLLHYWTPQFEVYQARLQRMDRDRQVLNHRYQEQVSQQTRWREDREQQDREWQRRLHEDSLVFNARED